MVLKVRKQVQHFLKVQKTYISNSSNVHSTLKMKKCELLPYCDKINSHPNAAAYGNVLRAVQTAEALPPTVS